MKAEVKQQETTAIADPNDSTGGALAEHESSVALSGEWGAEGTLSVPQFQLVQPGSEELAPEFGAGAYVFEKSVKISDGKTEVAFVVLHAQQYWRENLTSEERDSGKQPRSFDSLVEAESAGLRKGGYKDRGSGTVSSAARSLVLIEVPQELAVHEKDGKHYAKAMWYTHGVCYQAISKIVTAVQQTQEYRGKTYALNVGLTSRQGNKPTYHEPILHKHGFHTPEFIDWIEKEVL